MVIAREGLHPVLVVAGALAEDRFIDRGFPDYLAEEVDDLFGARQPA